MDKENDQSSENSGIRGSDTSRDVSTSAADKSQEAGLKESPAGEPPSEAPVEDNTPDYSIFTTWEKRGIVLGAAVGALLSPLTGQIYLPALPAVAADLHVSIAQINLTMTTYMIFQGLTPMVIGSLADSAGRRPAYLICFAVYVAANVGCALAPGYGALLVLRMLQSAGSSSTVALCQAVVADVVTSAERGSYAAFVALPTILGPSLGPVLGGVISQQLGWRWIFWVLAIIAAVIAGIHACFVPETCRYVVGDGSIRPPPAYRTLWQLFKEHLVRRRRQATDDQEKDVGEPHQQQQQHPELPKKKFNVFRSLVLLFEPEMFLLLGYGGLATASMFAVLTTMPTEFPEIYGLDQTQVGLMYLPMTAGTVLATPVVGRLQNWNYRRHCRLQGVPFDRRKQQSLVGFPIEKARLEVSLPFIVLATGAVAGWGWALERGAPLAVPGVLLALIGFTFVGFSNTIFVLIADTNPGNAGAATASNNIVRCLLSAAATAVIDPLIGAVGLGWAFVIFAALFVISFPAILLVMRNGVRWREEREQRKRRRKERKSAAGSGPA